MRPLASPAFVARRPIMVGVVCDYCGCRDVTPIRELSEEHERITELLVEVRERLGAGGEVAAAPVLAELQHDLRPHLLREESGIFAQLEAVPEFAEYLGRLTGDHNSARAGLLAVDPAGSGWAEPVLAGLEELVEHIGVEEYDLFPSSRVVIDDAGWGAVMEAHEAFDARRPQR